MNALNNIASYLPPKVRATVYTILATAILLEAVWDILPQPFEGKVLATLSVLGFGMAAVNATPAPLPPPAPPAGDVPEEFDGEFA
jgi:hypothetical protein